MIFVAEIEVFADHGNVGGGPILVEGVHDVGVKGRAEDLEVAVPLCAAEDEHVIAIDLTDGRADPAIERLQVLVVASKLRVMRDGLIQKFVAYDDRFLPVLLSDAAP